MKKKTYGKRQGREKGRQNNQMKKLKRKHCKKKKVLKFA